MSSNRVIASASFVIYWAAFCSLAAYGQGTVASGFVMQPWLTNAGDIRGVTVGQGAFGSNPYVYSFSLSSVLRVTAQETTQVFATGFTTGTTGRIAFAQGGNFGTDMYIASPIDGSGPNDPVYRVTSGGNVSVFNQSFDLLTKGLAFGNNTAFGDSLFLVDARNHSLQRLDAGGNATPFGTSLLSGSWEDDMVITTGGAFGQNAFVTDGIRDDLLRMTPSGVVSVFTPLQGALSIAVGEGVFGDNLYVGTYQGNVYRVDATGNASLFISGFGLHSPEGDFRGIAIADDTMWLTSDTGTLYRITPVPEPSSWSLVVVGVLICTVARIALGR
jgi:hypothetical protein